ncbi:hypothetical protein H0W80_00110 [Candidatus Saccharibacteria bacterium]|nr:hypothetical protein [Candidatus Saccharibacteria bacterium]
MNKTIEEQLKEALEEYQAIAKPAYEAYESRVAEIELEKDTNKNDFNKQLEFILFKHFCKIEPARAVDSIKAQKEILNAHQADIDKAIAEYIEPYIVNCVQNNGMSACKNCGLCRLREEVKDE